MKCNCSERMCNNTEVKSTSFLKSRWKQDMRVMKTQKVTLNPVMKMLSHALKTTQKCHPNLNPVNVVVNPSQQLSLRFWLQFTHINPPPPMTHRQNGFTNDMRIKGFFSCLIKTRAPSVWLTLVTFCGSHTFHRSAIPLTFKLSRVCKRAVYFISPDLDPSCAIWPGFRRSGA